MKWLDRLASKWKLPEQRVWLVIAALALALLLLAAAASLAYSSVIVAHAGVSIQSSHVIMFRGTTASGVLLDTGEVGFTLRLTAVNPSSHLLAFGTVAYRVWIEDLPAEAGLPNLGRQDNVLTNESGTHLFFAAFLGSREVDSPRIPAHGNATLSLDFALNRGADRARFAVVQNITEYAAKVRGNGTDVPWVRWDLVSLSILDLPTPDSAVDVYLAEMGRIVVEEGLNLGS